MDVGGYWTTEDADPRNVYHNVLITLDEAKHLNNGQPSFWGFHLDRFGIRANDHVIHLGCGTGYYSAIMAELVGPRGRITAIEIDEAIAARARAALEPWPQVTVIHGDGSDMPLETADAIIANAGATHPQPSWLAALKPGGKLLLPLAPTKGLGRMAYITCKSEEIFEAQLRGGVNIYEFSGARDPGVSAQLAEALKRDQDKDVKSLRCDTHEKDENCWLHGEGWCFSTCVPVEVETFV